MTTPADVVDITVGQGMMGVIGTILTVYVPMLIKALGRIREDMNANAKALTEELHKTSVLYEKRIATLETITKVLWHSEMRRKRVEEKKSE